MMTENKTTQGLSAEEQEALDGACEIIEAAFGRKIWKAFVNADKNKTSRVFGISFVFDARES